MADQRSLQEAAPSVLMLHMQHEAQNGRCLGLATNSRIPSLLNVHSS